MKILIIQENGRHEKNRNYRECFCLLRAFEKLNIHAQVWGLNHTNYNTIPNYNDYSLIINLENYGNGWEPDLSNVKCKKMLWSIDAHVKGEGPFLYEFNRGKYDILLHSTKDYVNERYKFWFPNAYDDTLIQNKDTPVKCDVGFCGSTLNREYFIHALRRRYNFIHDDFVLGDDMVNAIRSYKIHWNRNIANDVNYRNFETIGAGTPLVTNYNYQYEPLGFVHGKNVMFYNNEQELYSCIEQLLSNDSLRVSIKNEALKLATKHTYLQRAKYLLRIYENR